MKVYELKLGHRPVEPVIGSVNYTDDRHVWLQLKERDDEQQAGPPVDAYRIDVGPEKGHIFDAGKFASRH